MPRKNDDQIGHVPKITPAYDEIASFKRNQAKGSLAASLGEVPDVGGPASSMAAKTVLTLVVLALVVTAGWAGFLHMKLQATEQTLLNYDERIVDLERQLDVTDESMSESSVAMKVKLRELDSEIRKLWDNVWKKSRQRLDQHDQQLKQQQQLLAEAQVFIGSVKTQLSKNDDVVTGLGKQLQQAKTMMSQVSVNKKSLLKLEANVEATADKANRIHADLAKLDRRIKGTEEWIESINGFRRQVNRDLNTLKQTVTPAPN